MQHNLYRYTECTNCCTLQWRLTWKWAVDSSSLAADSTAWMWTSKAWLSGELVEAASGGQKGRPRRDSDVPILKRTPFRLASRTWSCGSSLPCDEMELENWVSIPSNSTHHIKVMPLNNSHTPHCTGTQMLDRNTSIHPINKITSHCHFKLHSLTSARQTCCLDDWQQTQTFPLL